MSKSPEDLVADQTKDILRYMPEPDRLALIAHYKVQIDRSYLKGFDAGKRRGYITEGWIIGGAFVVGLLVGIGWCG